MKATRLYTGPDNESHFEDIDIPLLHDRPAGQLSEPIPATSVVFRETTGDYDYAWHTAPRRQYVIMLGEVEIEVGDGTKRVLRTGDILLAEDTTGRGHQSRAVDNQPRRSIVITLD